MADNKKDMTGLMDFAQAMKDAGHEAPAPEGSVMEEQKIEKVDEFESLEDYGKANPAPEPPSEFAISTDEAAIEPTPVEAAPVPSEVAAPSEFANHEALPSDDAFATTPSEPATGLEGMSGIHSSPISDEAPSSFENSPEFAQPIQGSDQEFETSPEMPQDSPFETESQSPDSSPDSNVDSDPLSESISAAASEPNNPSALNGAPGSIVSSSLSALHPDMPEPAAAAPEIREPLRPAQKAQNTPKKPLEKIRQYSEQLSPAREAVQAAFPFSLLITGELAVEEKERLVDLLSRENMGVREIDLEPQFASGKILIPRISEYAGVLIVSALRSTRAKIRLGPSDSIFATPDTQDTHDSDDDAHDTGEREVHAYTSDSLHPAEDLPITEDDYFPGTIRHAVVDIVTASAALKTLVVQTESSPEYQTLLDALQRELKYKAYRKGATAIVSFSVHLTQLHMPMHYRVMVTGSAIKLPQ